MKTLTSKIKLLTFKKVLLNSKETICFEKYSLLQRINKISKFLQRIMIYIYFISINVLLFILLFKQGIPSIFTLIGEVSIRIAGLIFTILQVFLIFFLDHYLKRILIEKDRNALLYIIVFTPILSIIIYTSFLLTAPPQLLKLGYFEASLTLDKEYVEKSGFKKTYLEKCHPECLNKSSNDNYCKFFITCLEKCQTECLNELFKDTQNDNHCRTFKFFIFLRTGSEYIVGCNKDSNVRIHIPADKVIAIEYNNKTLTPPTE
jgi:uncharacterized membrane protein YfbV (UPF0208 family)